MKRRKILIDANPIVPYLVSRRISGIGRTCLELINGLNKIPLEELPIDIALYTQNLKGVSAKQVGTKFKTVHGYLRNNETGNKWAKRLHLREMLYRYDLQHITHNFEQVVDPSRCIVTVHDAMFFSYPEAFLGAEENRKKIPPFVRKAAHIITISENSKREIIEYMDVPAERITVIPWGVDHQLLYPHLSGNNRWTHDAPYFISVSCDIGRKNTITLLHAYCKFAKNNPTHHLILVWRNPSEDALKIAKSSDVKGLVHFAKNLSNEELADLYAGATASFFPSLYEGFGLPIVESMACGVPCVTARNSSLEEVGGDAALYVEPLDVDAICDVMEDFENEVYDLVQLRAASLAQASRFTWERCAKSTVEVYKQCLQIG